MPTKVFANASPSGSALRRRYAAAKVLGRFPWAATKLAHLGELADFLMFQQSRFEPAPLFPDREALWTQLAPIVREPNLTVIELGVAWGYATDWWLARMDDPSIRWHGFDTFTGLPQEYRTLPAGSFGAHGALPAIDDPRVQWHVGLVESTLHSANVARQGDGQLMVLFDLDLHGPSAHAWRLIRPILRTGDILYFDEAYDSSERLLLTDEVLCAGEFKLLGATTTGLALEVRALS